MPGRLLRATAIGLAALSSFVCACGDTPAAAGSADDEITTSKLEVANTSELPIAEVSGLGRRTVGSKVQYLAVGDAEPTLLTFDVRDGVASNIEKHDLSALVGRGPSQWEAVTGDGAGNVFILAEGTDRITVLDPRLEKVKHTIDLTFPAEHPLASDWKRDPNSRGEGIVLLANGHVMVVKEKDPVALVEFAPEGQAAEGYSAALALGLGDRAFPLPRAEATKLVATHHWVLKGADHTTLSDVSELAVEDDGRLLMLTDQGRAIVRVERGLRPDEAKIDVQSIHRLPSVDKPEGLVLAGGIPIVASDEKSPGKTLFTMGRLP